MQKGQVLLKGGFVKPLADGDHSPVIHPHLSTKHLGHMGEVDEAAEMTLAEAPAWELGRQSGQGPQPLPVTFSMNYFLRFSLVM